MQMYVQALKETKEFQNYVLEEVSEEEKFRFGPSQVYESRRAVFLPIKIGEQIKEIRMSVIEETVLQALEEN